jgi:hypothetical protein
MQVRQIGLNGDDPAHAKAFSYWWQGFLAGGIEELKRRSTPPVKPMQFDERRVEAGVIRALTRISDDPNPQVMVVNGVPQGPRVLAKGHQTLILTDPQYATLIKYCKQAMWAIAIIVDVDDAMLLLESAERGTDS